MPPVGLPRSSMTKVAPSARPLSASPLRQSLNQLGISGNQSAADSSLAAASPRVAKPQARRQVRTARVHNCRMRNQVADALSHHLENADPPHDEVNHERRADHQ